MKKFAKRLAVVSLIAGVAAQIYLKKNPTVVAGVTPIVPAA